MQKLNEFAEKYKNFNRVCFFIMLILTGLYFICGELLLPAENDWSSYRTEVYSAEWQRVHLDGSTEPIVFPGTYDAEEDGTMHLVSVLPQISSHTYMMFWSQRLDSEFYVGDELRYSYSTKDSRWFGKTSPAQYLFICLEPEDSGKVLTVLQSNTQGSMHSGLYRTIYYGDRLGLWLRIIESYGVETLIAFLVVLLGAFSVVFGIVLRHGYKKQSTIEFMGWGVMLASLWIITNSCIRQMIFPNISIVNDIDFLVISILPMPYLIYMNLIQKSRYRFLYQLVEVFVVLDFVVCAIFQVTGFMDLAESFNQISVVCIIAIGFLFAVMLFECVTGKVREYPLVAFGMFVIMMSAVIQMLMYRAMGDTPFNGSAIAAGLLFMIVITLIDTIKSILEIEKEKQQAVALSESKARFLANMSHEIRTPINAIIGMDELILNESKEATTIEYANDIRSASSMLLSLVNDILDFSKIESDKMTIIPVEYELHSLVNDSYMLLKNRARDKNLQVCYRYSDTLPKRLIGDEVRIRQIITNLVTNAVKYTHEGSVTLQVGWKPMDSENVSIVISVIDTGIGIEKESIGKLFFVFERIDEKNNRNIEGTGLGLNITKRLVDMMGGTIEVQSELGKGSNFTVTIPQKIVVNDSDMVLVTEGVVPNRDRSNDLDISFTAPNARILVVDDVRMNLKVFAGLLKSTGIQIDEAESGRECLEKVKNNSYDIVFLDHMMPEMDGMVTLQQMRKLLTGKKKMPPVIMLTANAIVGAREEYIRAGFDDYLSKPIESHRLKQMIHQYLPVDLIQPVTEAAATELAATQKASDSSGVSAKAAPDTEYDVTALNMKNAMIYCGSEELLREMIQMFVDGDKSAEIQKYYEDEDWKNYQIQVHALKSTSKSIGADAFSELAKGQEQAAKNGEIAYVKEHHEDFIKAYRKLLQYLKNR